MTTRERVCVEARAWLKTPYHHMARVKGVGVDCAQLLIGVYSCVGLIPVLDVGYYSPDWHMHRSEEKYLGFVQAYATRVETPLPGDVALFKFGRCISHAGIVIEWPRMIHSYFRMGCVYVDATDAELRGRLDSFWSVVKDEA